ncbi:MAG: hypothetical protein OXT67_08860, partial [Zetaproteobacteria bacterium]|nr:hypothetical protein [Zetaproteobacteria bacterium]
MIYINFAPRSETEDRLWFIPDLAASATIFIFLYLGSQLYIVNYQEDINTLKTQSREYALSHTRLKP